MDYYKLWMRVPSGRTEQQFATQVVTRIPDAFVTITQGMHGRKRESTLVPYASVYVPDPGGRGIEALIRTLTDEFGVQVFHTAGVSHEFI